MNRKILLSCIICLSFGVWPRVGVGQIQQIKSYGSQLGVLRGNIVDSTGKTAVPFAHLFFVRGKDTIKLAADMYGRFTYRGEMADTLYLRVTAMGFKAFSGKYIPRVHGVNIQIRLRQEAMVLNEIIVTGKRLVMVVKGDTLRYNTDVIVNLEEDFMDMLVKKLPGVRYEGGSLFVNGQRISRILVNGSDSLFQNDVTAVLQTIKADNVKDIKVYDERNKEDLAQGLKYGRREKVMDVTTKERVTRWSMRRNRLSLAGGIDASNTSDTWFKDRYDFRLTYTSPKQNWKLNGWARTDAVERFFSGGFVYSTPPGAKITYTTSNNFSNRTKYAETYRMQEFFPTAMYDSRSYENTFSSKESGYNYSTKHEFTRKGKISRWNGTFSYSRQSSKNREQNRSLTLMNGEQMASVNALDYDQEYISEGHGLLQFRHSFPGNIGLFVGTTLDLERGDGEGWQVDTLVESTSRVYRDKDLKRQNLKWGTTASFGKTLTPFWRMSFRYSFNYSERGGEGESINRLTGLLDTNSTKDYTFYNQSHGGNLLFHYMALKTEMNVRFSVNYNARNHVERFPYREQYRDCYLAWGGGLWIKKTCSPVLNWEVSYTIGTTPPKEEQSRGVIDDRNPLNLQAGNPNLKPKEEHRLTAKWNKLFISNSSSLGLKVDYLLVRNDVASNSRFFSENTYLSAYDVQRGATLYTYKNTKPNHLVTAKVDYSQLSRLLKSSIKMYVEYTFEKRPSFTQGKPNDLIRNKGVFFFVVESNFSRKVRLSLQSNTQLSSDKSTLNKASEFLDEQASIGVHTNVISKFGVGANFIYTYKKDLALGEDSGKPNLMVNISRRLGRYTSLVLRGINLLDKSTSETFGKTADYTFRSRQLRTAGRCFMLSLDYQF